MSFTGQLGTTNSVLAQSIEPGAGAGAGSPSGTSYSVSASSALSLTQTQQLTSRPLRAASSLTLSQVATPDYPRHLVGSTTLAITQGAAYVGPKHLAASGSLVLAQNAYQPVTESLFATSPLILSQSASVGGTLRLSASNALALTSIVDTTVKIRDAVSTLAIAQSAVADKIKTATSQLVLSQEADKGTLFLKAVSPLVLAQWVSQGPIPFGLGQQIDLQPTQITLGQTATTNIKVLQASTSMVLAQAVTVRVPKYVAGASQLSVSVTTVDVVDGQLVTTTTITGLQDTADVAKVLNRPVSQNIPLVQSATAQVLIPTAQDLAASSAITLTQGAILSKTVTATSLISLTQAAKVDVGQATSSTLSVAQSASFTTDHAQEDILSTIELNHAASFLLELGNTRFLYAPFIGENTDPNAPTPPPAKLGYPLANQPAFQVVYPASGLVTDALQIRAPNLGNKDRLAFNRINRETRGGKLIVFADPMWPKSQTMVLQFSALHKAEAYATLAFLQNHIGQQVGIVDWEWYYWLGVITNLNDPIVQDGPDSFSASFEFEGVYATWTEQTIPSTNLGCESMSRVAVSNRNAMITCDCTVDTQTQGTTAAAVTAETDSDVSIGMPIYVTAAGHIDLAVANNVSASQVAGITLGSYSPGVAAAYLTEGEVTSNDWTAVTGGQTLQPGRIYFLDPSTPGRLTTVPPTSIGQYVVPVGRALSTITLDIELTPSILL